MCQLLHGVSTQHARYKKHSSTQIKASHQLVCVVRFEICQFGSKNQSLNLNLNHGKSTRKKKLKSQVLTSRNLGRHISQIS